MKIFINRATVNGPWGGGAKFVSALHELAPQFGHRIVSSLDADPHVILLAGLDRDALGVGVMDAFAHRAANPSCKIALRLNDCDARKGTTGVDRAFWATAAGSDSLIFVSEWLRDHLIDRWSKDPESARTSTLPGITRCAQVIHNGVDRKLFAPINSESTDRLRVVAQNQRISIVSSHWSDNYLKGQDYVEWLDAFVGQHPRDFAFTFIGRTKATLKHGVHVSPLAGEQFAKALAAHDVCVNASRWDPGPNSVLETISCGLPTYVHIDGGGAVEFAGTDHTFSSSLELEKLLWMKQFKLNQKPPSWEMCIQQYLAALTALVAGVSMPLLV